MMQHTALLVGSYPICIRATTAGNTKRMNEQVSHGVSNVVFPLPTPPLRKGRGLDFLLSPLSKGELRGVNNHTQLVNIEKVSITLW